jgi:hypothetical protein
LSGAAGNFSISGALAVTGTTTLTGATNLNAALTYGGVTLSNAVTGTGSMALSASPTFTGTPAAPTASPGTNTTQLATTAFVTAATGTLGTMAIQNANAVAITGGTITGITDLAVADGGTGASTFTANNVLLGNGTSAFQVVAPSTSGNLLVSNGTTWTSTTLAASGIKLGLGITGEVWSDVISTYVVNTNYTNNLSYPIAMTVEWSNGNKSFTVNGVLNASASASGGNTQTSMFIIIPAGATWQLVAGGGGINRWTQLS